MTLFCGASQFLKDFHQHLGPNRDQMLTSENPQLQRRPEAQEEDRSYGTPSPPPGLPSVRQGAVCLVVKMALEKPHSSPERGSYNSLRHECPLGNGLQPAPQPGVPLQALPQEGWPRPPHPGPDGHSRGWDALPALDQPQGPEPPDKGDRSGDTISKSLARAPADLA